VITLKQEIDGTMILFQLPDEITADDLIGEVKRFMVAVGYEQGSVHDAIVAEAEIIVEND